MTSAKSEKSPGVIPGVKIFAGVYSDERSTAAWAPAMKLNIAEWPSR